MGTMGQHHARVLSAMDHAVLPVDIDPERAPTHLIPKADAAVIATPPDETQPAAVVALDMGMRVLVEKPGGLNCDQLDGLDCMGWSPPLVNYTETHNPAVQALAQHLHLAGTIRHISIRRLGLPGHGTPALDLASHDLAVLRHLGFRPTVLHALQEDGHLTATLRLNDQATVTLEASHLHPRKIRTLSVIGDRGMLDLDYQAQSLVYSDPHGMRELAVDRAEPLKLMWQAFFRGEGVSASEGVEVLRLVEQMEAAQPLKAAA